MSVILRVIEFDDELLPLLADFECGDAVWERVVSDWIKDKPVDDNLRESLALGTKVWLYANDDNEVIGFGSLGESNWRYPGEKDPRQAVAIIPNLAVAKRFQGLPAPP